VQNKTECLEKSISSLSLYNLSLQSFITSRLRYEHRFGRWYSRYRYENSQGARAAIDIAIAGARFDAAETAFRPTSQ